METGMSRIGPKHRVQGSVFYTIEASLPVQGFFKPDRSTCQSLVVDVQPEIEPLTAVLASATREIDFLGWFSKGTCTITVALASVVLQIGQPTEIHFVIQNDSTKNSNAVRVELLQQVHISPTETGESRVFREEYKTNIGSGETRVLVLQLRISYSGRGWLVPPSRYNLFSISYHLRVTSVFSLCPDVPLEFPVAIVQ